MEEPKPEYEVGHKVRVYIGEDSIGDGEVTGINPPNGFVPGYSYDVRTEKGEGVYFNNELKRANPDIQYQTTTTLSTTREVILTVGLAYPGKLLMYVHSTDEETDMELCEVSLTKQRARAMRIALDKAIIALELSEQK